ncbi:peptidoglycan editing factor PgeF [Fredinandcohnia humi]
MNLEPFIKGQEQVLELTAWRHLSDQIAAGFTTRNGGESQHPFDSFNLGLHVTDDAKKVNKNRETLSEILGFPTSNWVCSEQTHDNKIVKVTREHLGAGVYEYEQSIKDTDGLYTDEKNILLTLCYADCVPLFFYSPEKERIGIAHAGWKGSVKDVGGKMVRTWCKDGIEPNEIYAVIGPAIGKCCYVVDDYVKNFVDNLLKEDFLHPYDQVSENQYSLDLKQLNYVLLLKAGLSKENIKVSSYCTSCEENLFFSHRRDKGKTGRMMNFIGLKEV